MTSKPAIKPTGLTTQQMLAMTRWTEDQIVAWEERAAILEHVGRVPRREAERRAFEEAPA